MLSRRGVATHRLQQAAVVRRGQCQEGGVLLRTRQGRHGECCHEEMWPHLLQQAAVVRKGRYQQARVLLRTRQGRHGECREQDVCGHTNCSKRPSYGEASARKAEFCLEHSRDGMVNVVAKKRCGHTNCNKRPSYGEVGTGNAQFCSEHATDDMVDVINRRCGHTSCNKWPYYSFAGRGRAREFCAQHAGEGMIFGARNQCGEGKASTAGGQVGSPARGKTARVVGDGGKKRCTATPSNQPAASSGVQKSNKQARAAVDGAAAASSPVAGGTTSAPEPGSEGEGAAAAETASLALGSTVKDEPAAACNVETAEFQGVSMSSTTWATQPTQRLPAVSCCRRTYFVVSSFKYIRSVYDSVYEVYTKSVP